MQIISCAHSNRQLLLVSFKMLITAPHSTSSHCRARTLFTAETFMSQPKEIRSTPVSFYAISLIIHDTCPNLEISAA
jgi:hypothetical protein